MSLQTSSCETMYIEALYICKILYCLRALHMQPWIHKPERMSTACAFNHISLQNVNFTTNTVHWQCLSQRSTKYVIQHPLVDRASVAGAKWKILRCSSLSSTTSYNSSGRKHNDLCLILSATCYLHVTSLLHYINPVWPAHNPQVQGNTKVLYWDAYVFITTLVRR